MSNPNEVSNSEATAEGAVELTLSYDRAISYAFQQNAIPVIRELCLKNRGGVQEELTIRISTEPAFASTAELHVQRLEPAGEFRISPVDLRLSHDFLDELTEKVCGYLKIDVLKAGVVIATKSEPIDLLARNEWCGLVSLPEILAAFVTPNDPAIMPILGRASELLQTHTGRAAFNGYQDKSRKRAWEQVASIYKAVGECGIRYISPPASFESTGQKVRLPSEIISQKFGTCLDLTLLMAACCEQAGLNPLVLMHEGHAYAGCWLDDRTFPESAHDDLQQVRKMETDAIITVFETTMLASESPGTLESAELHAKPHLKTEIPFRLALDIRRARGARILPLPQRGKLSDGTPVPGGEARTPTHDGLGTRGFIESVDQAGLTPQTPESRIDQWKSRLLDLSLRNRLLNFRETNATIRIVFASPEHIEDELSAEREIVLRPKARVLGEDDPRSAASRVASWLQLVDRTASRATLANFGALAESLRLPEPVGPAFLTTPWTQLSVDLDRWISFAQVRAELRAKLRDYDETRLLALDLDPLLAKWQSAQSAWFLLKWLRIGSVRRQVRKARIDGSRPAVTTLAEVLASAVHLRQINATLAAATPTAVPCLGVIWNRGEPAADALVRARCWGEGLHAELIATVEDDLSGLARLRTFLAGLFAEGIEIFGATTSVGRRLNDYAAALLAFNTAYDSFRRESRLDDTEIGLAPDHLAAVKVLTDRIPEGWGKIREWCSWQKIRQQAVQIGLSTMVGWIETNDVVEADLAALFERSFRQALLFAALDRDPILRGFFGHEHADRIGRFRELDGKIAELTRDLIRGRLAGNIPTDSLSADFPKAELGLLRREIGKRIRHIPVRKLLANIPTLLPRLKPCVLMSPLSVAQYLDASHQSFDVVIFDEASQIPVWDAVGAIARGKQLIVVGDPKQLPPTNFFNTSDDDDDDLSSEEFKDMESILDELLSNGLRHKRLQWHYRSRHEGLITFSNRQYYENSLLTFPSPDTSGGGIQFRHLPAARYDKGKSRTNMGEARALVDELVRRLRKADGPRFSYGVVTFSQAQQQLVENLLDEERRKYPSIEIHFGDKPPVESEPVFVKNLESVQGDERDVILFSICYGPDETGSISMNFGPLNRDGGERRLNVAITRAKHEVIVFSGLRGDQIDLTRTRARGVRDLKYFLDYAERGPLALVAATSALPDGEADSEFERLVAGRIRDAGYDVHHQVGCSDYRIDLGIVDSAKPGRYLLGVECDGATYHRAATARDRDKLRQSVLEDLGWRIHRIWSTDWWHGPEEETRKLLAVLKGAEDDARADEALSR